MSIRLEFNPADCWIGVYWRPSFLGGCEIWICLLPMLPIHISWYGARGRL